uniref:GRIP and coiled-coil domain-containing protein n=1 Tax=Rhizophora mucronata TaxID=61149 RepID=A0A2P2JTV5_RHIMU
MPRMTLKLNSWKATNEFAQLHRCGILLCEMYVWCSYNKGLSGLLLHSF